MQSLIFGVIATMLVILFSTWGSVFNIDTQQASLLRDDILRSARNIEGAMHDIRAATGRWPTNPEIATRIAQNQVSPFTITTGINTVTGQPWICYSANTNIIARTALERMAGVPEVQTGPACNTSGSLSGATVAGTFVVRG